MLYSVWNWDSKNYDYYQTSGPEVHAPASRSIHSASQLGATPDEAAVDLPDDAAKIGNGEEPKGQIASKEGSSISPTWGIALLVVGAAILMGLD